MIKLLLCGCNGYMGRVITSCVDAREKFEIVADIDLKDEMNSTYPVFSKAADFHGEVDVIIDFSHPSALAGNLEYALKNNTPIIIATTGLSKEQIDDIHSASQKIPVFFTANMSIGVNLMTELVKKATALLCDDFDIEVIEAHHNQKIDAPSGTANMLISSIQEACNEPKTLEFDRHSKRKKREKCEIGVHAIRGGTIVGEHTVMFAGRDEIFSISHSARSKEVFAVGSLNAAEFMVDKTAGLYSMSDVISGL